VAQEREKRRIVIASILKPVDDTRMFEKMATSLHQTNQFEVTVIGYEGPGTPAHQNITCQSLGRFKRLSFSRWTARWKVLRLALAARPHIFIFTTHELLTQAIILKVLINTRIIYDVRENYYRNILHSEGLPALLRLPLALMVRLKEKLTAPAIDHFLLAEKGYEQEIKFHRGGWTVIENKALNAPIAPRSPGLRLLFTGTLSESNGVFRAIQLAGQMHRVDPRIHLTIAGYAAAESVRQRLMTEGQAPYVTLIGIDKLVSHEVIARLIAGSNAGIIAYVPSRQNVNAVPTKLFEYLAAGLPIIVENSWPWVERYQKYKPFLFTHFDNPDSPAIIRGIQGDTFYTSLPTDVSWRSEGPQFVAAIKNMA